MTEPTRGPRARRGNRRPGSLLLTVLLVLAIVSSSVLVFTNRVELLKLAVIIALWAAVVAAFVSFIYRRQSDIDSAKSRDLKLVYDLQLDREISARREYELSVETQLRRELASELRAQSSDEVTALRAELAALRANLEIIFDTDLQSRPAIENERTSVHTFGDFDAVARVPAQADRVDRGPGHVISSRIDAENDDDSDPNTEESPIIDVPAEPHPPEDEWSPDLAGGAHRRASERQQAGSGWGPSRSDTAATPDDASQGGRRRAPDSTPEIRPEPVADGGLPWLPPDSPFVPPAPVVQQPTPPQQPPPQWTPPPRPEPRVQRPAPQVQRPEPQLQRPEPQRPEPPRRQEPERVARHAPAASDWQPAPAEGQFIPAGAPGSNWASPATDVPDVQPPAPPTPSAPMPPAPTPPAPTMSQPPAEPARPGRHANTPPAVDDDAPRRARHSVAAESGDPGRRAASPTLATPPQVSTPQAPTPEPTPAETPPAETTPAETTPAETPAPEPTTAEPAPSPPDEPPTTVADGAPEPPARHRGPDEPEEPEGQHIGGQPVSELMARLQATPTGGGRRRRREE